MDAYRIIGGRPLQGTVTVSGSKNAALPILAASLLADGMVSLGNVPRVADVDTLTAVLRHLGLGVERDHELTKLTTDHRASCVAPEHLVSRMRASFCVLGPLLARRGRAVVALPGGCNLGDRPVDLHLRGLTALGADIRAQQGYVVAWAKRLRGAKIDMMGPHGPTVTGTANVMMAATLAEGTTRITGAACEPEIVELGRFLQDMGADIEGLGTELIVIRGVEQLTGTSFAIPPDRIEAATFLVAAAITGGDVRVEGARRPELASLLELLSAAGATMTHEGSEVTLSASRRPLQAFSATAEPHPGLPTDLQPLLLALACTAAGTSRIVDRVFPDRWRHAAELRRLGGSIRVRDGVAVVDGRSRLTGARVTASDLRAGAALVLAGLAAQGETIVTHLEHIDRGYERLDEKLRLLGADIERVPVRDARATRNSIGSPHNSLAPQAATEPASDRRLA